MKELFGQSLVESVADSDRIVAAIPGQLAAKNILFSKFWAQLKSIFGTNNWSARTYSSSPCIVVYEKQQYILDETLAPLPFNSTDFPTELADGKWVALGGGSGASNTLNVALSTPLLGQTNQDGLNVQFESVKANKITSPVTNRILKATLTGDLAMTNYTEDQLLNTADIDVSSPSWLESEERLITVKKVSGQADLSGAAELMDLLLPPGVLATLESSDANWTNETKTVTGDNSTYALGRLGQIGWLSDRTFVQCTTATYTVSGSATFNRNRAVDSLNMNDTQDALVINQLDPSKNYPAGTNTGNSTDLGWDLLTQTKALNNTTYPSKLGSWWIGGINGEGYSYFCYAISGGNAYWKRNGQAEAVQRTITSASHPTLTGRLLAKADWATSVYTQQAGDGATYQDQTFWDATTRSYFIKMTSTTWEKLK